MDKSQHPSLYRRAGGGGTRTDAGLDPAGGAAKNHGVTGARLRIVRSLPMMRAVLAVLLAAGTANAADTANDKVVEYAKSQVGKQVGNGECWTLANEAMKLAGTKSSFHFTDTPNKGDYVWGTLSFGLDGKGAKESGALKDVKPGDIMQFRDAKFSGRKGNGTYTMTASHHTAVVVKADKMAKTITILHQNWNGKKTVAEETLPLGDLKEGWIKVYRPQPK
jgi:hypothetical protein